MIESRSRPGLFWYFLDDDQLYLWGVTCSPFYIDNNPTGIYFTDIWAD